MNSYISLNKIQPILIVQNRAPQDTRLKTLSTVNVTTMMWYSSSFLKHCSSADPCFKSEQFRGPPYLVPYM